MGFDAMSIAEVVITNFENDLGKNGGSCKAKPEQREEKMKVDASPSRRNATAAGCPRRDCATTSMPPLRASPTPLLQEFLTATSPPPHRASPTPPLQDALATTSPPPRYGLAVTSSPPRCGLAVTSPPPRLHRNHCDSFNS
ncbi:hypothetical protein LR48_Vigan11g008100 [Vigna angularis]|uniref:Uncharacterized protein n=1 Tax=Phaseolus angularis TaxID=3914 RepID=A0A0L9VQM8_PHAAN|nr:hypothetical protein LR48_Vigan11g008100 [Vigna angularis]